MTPLGGRDIVRLDHPPSGERSVAFNPEIIKPSAFICVRERSRIGRLIDDLVALGWTAYLMNTDDRGHRGARPELWVVDMASVGPTPGLFFRGLASLGSGTPLLLCSRADELKSDRELLVQVPSLWTGKMDVIVMPYEPEELAVRVGWLMRSERATERLADHYDMGPLRLDGSRYTVSYDGRPVSLTPTEFRMLLALLQAGGTVVPEEVLKGGLPRRGGLPGDGPIESHVSRLRQKLHEAGMERQAVLRIRGVGYRLDRDRLTQRGKS